MNGRRLAVSFFVVAFFGCGVQVVSPITTGGSEGGSGGCSASGSPTSGDGGGHDGGNDGSFDCFVDDAGSHGFDDAGVCGYVPPAECANPNGVPFDPVSPADA